MLLLIISFPSSLPLFALQPAVTESMHECLLKTGKISTLSDTETAPCLLLRLFDDCNSHNSFKGQVPFILPFRQHFYNY